MLAWLIFWPSYNLKRMRLLNEYLASECGPVNIQAVCLSRCHFEMQTSELLENKRSGDRNTLFSSTLFNTHIALCWICFQSETHIALCWGPFPK